MALRIPFNRVSAVGAELAYIGQALEQGHISGDGPFSQRCEALLEQALGAPRVLLTTSCTHALELAALLLEIEPGDEVVVPAFTFPSTAGAFSLRGARIVFCDIHESTLNLDERILESLVCERTKAVVAVHYAGVGCEMDAILAVAQRAGLAVVEDNAHGLFGRYRGKPLGTFGVLATQSFHETKNCTCGEGGALVVNDPTLASRGEVLREKGTNRKAFFRGEVDKYTWVDEGSSYVPSDILAAFLAAQLEASDVIQAARERIWHAYAKGLDDWAASVGARLPHVPDDRDQPYHMFYVLLPSLAYRTALIEHLRGLGIGAVFHYLPLHLSPMGERNGGRRGECPVTEDVADRLLRLPFYVGLSPAEQDEVIEAIVELEFPDP
jgi:dTDP-4-amino-4,6-dideoxygalactose transaminase